MRGWTAMLGGLLVWAGHFFLLYIVGSVFEATLAGTITIVATVAALAANVLILFALRRAHSDGFAAWMRSVGVISAALSIVAVLWQGLPAVIG